MAGLIKGIHHVSLKCENDAMFDETIHFYREVLGMPIVREWAMNGHRAAMLATGSGVMEISAQGQAADITGTINHLALATDDVDGCVAAVRAAGYRITTEPRDAKLGEVDPLPIRIAFCVGPVGEEIEFFCEKR